VYIRDPTGLPDGVITIIQDIAEFASHVLSVPPVGIQITFAGRRLEMAGGERIAIERIRKAIAEFPSVTIGWGTGLVIGRVDGDGKFLIGPLGDVLNRAMLMASGTKTASS
jgi:hypothetical protein